MGKEGSNSKLLKRAWGGIVLMCRGKMGLPQGPDGSQE